MKRKTTAAKAAPTIETAPTVRIVELTGLTERRLRQLASDGRIPEPSRGQWDLVGVIRGLVARHDERDGTLTEARRIKEQHRARRERVLADLAEKSVVPLVDMELLWSRDARAVVTRLRGVGAKAAALCEGKSVAERQRVIQREIDDCTDQLYRDHKRR